MTLPILQQLKTQTHPHHLRVEQAFDLPTRLNNLQTYAQLLQQLLTLYAPLEEQLATIDLTPAHLDFPSRRKTHLLQKDLALLNLATTPIPPNPNLPTILTLPQALGCMYVMEGATLGGQIIRRQIQDRLHLTPETGAAFFASYGPNVAAQWKSFCTALTTTCTTQDAITQTLATAIQTFQSFEQALTR